MTYQSFKQWLFVELPAYAIDPWIMESYNRPNRIGFYNPNKSFGEEELMVSESVDIPSGSYTIIGKGSELTEEQKLEIRGHFLTSEQFFKSLGYENPGRVLILKNNEA